MVCPACHRPTEVEAEGCPHCGADPAAASADLQGSAVLGPQAHAREDAPPEPALVNQEHALRRLRAAWRTTRGGRGQFVSLVGEVGSGRSRLVRELGRTIDREAPGACWLVGQANSYATYVAYHLLAELLAPWVPDDCNGDAARVGAALAGLAGARGDGSGERAALLDLAGQLRGGTAARRVVPADLAAALAGPLARATAGGPLIVVLEDLEWVDAPSRAALDALLPALLEGPTLVLCTHHADWSHEWPGVARHYHLILGPLGRAESGRLVEAAAAWAGQGALPEGTVEALVRAAEGNPLLLEQATLAVCEQWTERDRAAGSRVAGPAVPTSLQEAILARLAALPPAARAVLVAAATIGQRFGRAAIAAVTDGHPDLDAGLDELLRRRWIERWREGREVLYRFSHGYLQEVAYSSLEGAERQTLEARVADWLLRAADAGSADATGEIEEPIAPPNGARAPVTPLPVAATTAPAAAREDLVIPQADPSEAPGGTPLPGLAAMVPAERNAALARIVLGDLPADRRASVVLCLQHGYTYAEAGEALGLPRDEVRAYLYEARQLFRRLAEATSPGGNGVAP